VTAPCPSGPPLVSCVMVTRGRAAFVRQSIRYFQAQDYPHRELVIVHEDETDLPEPMPDDARVRCRRVAPGLTVGAKRNAGAAEARGDLIAQWDDDDWYAPARLRCQAAPILTGAADITGLRASRFFELDTWTLWTCSRALHARMFIEDVAAGTLVYRRELWGRPARYPATSLREDADFLVAAMRAGARLERLAAEDLFVYIRHGGNTWRFVAGELLMPGHWRAIGEPAWPPEVDAFYRAQSRRRRVEPPAHRPPRSGRQPRVACIMPTCDRHEMVPRAVRHFQRQSYGHKQLVVIDDGVRPVAPLLPADDRIRCIRLAGRTPLGTKRNLACEAVDADVIVHWDDDDWMAPSWIDAQVRALVDAGTEVTGLDQVHFYAPVERRAWRYVYPAHSKPWVHGATLCYARSFWLRNPFQPVTVGEDLRFLWNGSAPRLTAHDRSDLFVAYVHARNTSPKRFISARWQACPVEHIDRLMLKHGDPEPARGSRLPANLSVRT
jgi:glycosyltransferase involved in cell wall biosynthesis